MRTQCKHGVLELINEWKLFIIWLIISIFLIMFDWHVEHEKIYNIEVYKHILHFIDNIQDFKLDSILIIVTIITAFIPLFELLKEDKIFGIELNLIYNNISLYDLLLKWVILMMILTRLFYFFICMIFQFTACMFLIMFYYYDVLSIKGKYIGKRKKVLKVINKKYKADMKLSDQDKEESTLYLAEMFKNIDKKDFKSALFILENFLKKNSKTMHNDVFYKLSRFILSSFFKNEKLYNKDCTCEFLKKVMNIFIENIDHVDSNKHYKIKSSILLLIFMIELASASPYKEYIKKINLYINELAETNGFNQLDIFYFWNVILYLNQKNMIMIHEESLDYNDFFNADETDELIFNLRIKLQDDDKVYCNILNIIYMTYKEKNDIFYNFIYYEFFVYVESLEYLE